MSALQALSHLHPDAALWMLTGGILLVYLELNRPGRVLPGAAGLALALLAVSSLLRYPLRPLAVLLLTGALALEIASLVRRVPPILSVAAPAMFVLAFRQMIPHTTNALSGSAWTHTQPSVHTFTAVSCGLVLGLFTFVFTGIARRARTNKRVN